MKQDEIIEMAKQAGLIPVLENVRLGNKNVLAIDCIEAFAKLVEDAAASKEREACAELCENYGGFKDGHSCASSIRARGEA